MDVTSTSYNASGEHIAVAGNGFHIIESFPRRLVINRVDLGPLILVKMKGKTNLLAFVRRDRPFTVTVYDDREGRAIGELGPYTSNVKNVAWGEDVIAVVLAEGRVLVYDISDLRLVHQDTTFASENETVEVVSAGGTTKVAYPGSELGTVVVVRMPIPASQKSDRSTIKAHKHEIAALALSPDGSRLATASATGTVLRIFDVQASGHLELELRRSATSKAHIHDMSFSYDAPSSLLACVGDSGTLHIFDVAEVASPRLTLAQRSRWRAELPGKGLGRSAVSFHQGSPKPLVTAVSQTGSWHVAYVVEDDGNMRLLENVE